VRIVKARCEAVGAGLVAILFAPLTGLIIAGLFLVGCINPEGRVHAGSFFHFFVFLWREDERVRARSFCSRMEKNISETKIDAKGNNYVWRWCHFGVALCLSFNDETAHCMVAKALSDLSQKAVENDILDIIDELQWAIRACRTSAEAQHILADAVKNLAQRINDRKIVERAIGVVDKITNGCGECGAGKCDSEMCDAYVRRVLQKAQTILTEVAKKAEMRDLVMRN
jgi:hypothetical protein